MKSFSAMVVGSVALAESSSMPPIKPMLCKLVGTPSLEKKVVDAVCSKQSRVPEAECEMGLSKIWEGMAAKECSKGVLTAIPPMACKLVKNEALEKKAVDALCSKQTKFPAAECEMALTKMWDALAVRECPTAELATAMPIKPMLCKLVETSALEKKAVDAVCSKQSKVPATECEMGLSKIWDAMAAKECSKGELAAIPPMACKLVQNEALEKKAIDALCSKQSKVPAAECEMALTKMWDALATRECPEVQLTEAMPPIKPMLCKLVTTSALEKKAIDAVCSKQSKVPVAECEVGLSKIWEGLAAKECSTGELAAIPPMACKLVKNDALEKKAIDALCSKQSKIPVAECEMALTKMWDALATRECPDMRLAVAMPPIKPMLCKLVGTPALEKKVVDAVCSKQSKVPVAECEAGLSKIWEGIAARECSKGVFTAMPPMVCSVVKNGALEKKAVEMLCSKQSKIPASECDMALTKLWDALATKECPSVAEESTVIV